MARRKKKRYVKRKTMTTLKNWVAPVAIATFTEPMLDNAFNNLNIGMTLPYGVQLDDVAKVGLGFYFGRKGGTLGRTATLFGLFGMKNIMSSFIGGMSNGGNGGGSSNGSGF